MKTCLALAAFMLLSVTTHAQFVIWKVKVNGELQGYGQSIKIRGTGVLCEQWSADATDKAELVIAFKDGKDRVYVRHSLTMAAADATDPAINPSFYIRRLVAGASATYGEVAGTASTPGSYLDGLVTFDEQLQFQTIGALGKDLDIGTEEPVTFPGRLIGVAILRSVNYVLDDPPNDIKTYAMGALKVALTFDKKATASANTGEATDLPGLVDGIIDDKFGQYTQRDQMFVAPFSEE